MSLKVISAVVVGAIVASAAWHYRDSALAQSLLGTTPKPQPKPFVFDNGSVRDHAPASSEPGQPVASSLPQGALRKCAKGGEVIYTNVACPARYKELGVGGNVNVVASAEAAKPAKAEASGASAPSKLHKALGMTPDERLRDRMMERAIEAHTR